MIVSGDAPGWGAAGRKTGALTLPALLSLLFPTGPEVGIRAQPDRRTMSSASSAAGYLVWRIEALMVSPREAGLERDRPHQSAAAACSCSPVPRGWFPALRVWWRPWVPVELVTR